MNQHLQPFVQSQIVPANQGNVQQMGQQLVQVLGLIAQTQQEILNRLPTAQQGGGIGAVVENVPEFPIYGTHKQKYTWLYHHGLFYNLDRTRRRVQVTVADIEEHQKLLNDY